MGRKIRVDGFTSMAAEYGYATKLQFESACLGHLKVPSYQNLATKLHSVVLNSAASYIWFSMVKLRLMTQHKTKLVDSCGQKVQSQGSTILAKMTVSQSVGGFTRKKRNYLD